MNQVEHIRSKVREHHLNEPSGHDFGHIDRVYNLALSIAMHYDHSDKMLVAMAALLHDVADHKFVSEDQKNSVLDMMRSWLISAEVDHSSIEKILYICENISFSRSSTNGELSLEGQIVQDADRLDAIGAVGVARTFAYGGANGRVIYSSDGSQEDTVKHFYDKLLKVKYLINTSVAREEAQRRHAFLESFLDQFYSECRGVF